MHKISTLDNGLRLVTQNMPSLETVSMGIWNSVGGRDELENINGVAHLLEHMAFKGTTKRSALEIAETIENVGGDVAELSGKRALIHAYPWKWPEGDASVIRLVGILDPGGDYRIESGKVA